MPWKALMPVPTAFWSSSAVAISSSTLIDSISERLAHMSAAGAQDLHHLVLIRHRIEMGLHVLRLSRNFAQRNRGCENLDEESFHLGLLAVTALSPLSMATRSLCPLSVAKEPIAPLLQP